MKTKQIFATLAGLVLLLPASVGYAVDVTAIGSGLWGDPGVWQDGIVPGTNDTVIIDVPHNITVNTNAAAQEIFGTGTLTMGADSTLTILGNYATYQLSTLDTTATGNTVIYAGNPFYAKQCDYYNLVFANTNYVDPFPPYTPFQNFNNFSSFQGPTPMTIAGDMTVIGHTRVQQGSGGAPITIGGNLIIGTGCSWDSSGDILTVAGDVSILGVMLDLNGALGSNHFGGSVIVEGPSTSVRAYPGGPYTNGWHVSDVITWGVGGSLTNDGSIFGDGYGSISFEGEGVIAGTNPLKIPTMTVSGIYTVGTTITLITNTPTLHGTLVFDLANTNRLVLLADAGTPLYYDGALNVINTGAAPVGGNSYKCFEAPSYDGAFTSVTLPPLDGGLSWQSDLLSSGSITVIGGGGSPVIVLSRNGSTLTLSWDTSSFPGYSVQANTNSAGVGGGIWADAGSGGVSPFEIQLNSANSGVYFRLVK